MSFGSPWALLGLFIVPVVVLAYIAGERRREKAVERFANPALFEPLVPDPPGYRRHLPVAVLLLALVAMVVGAARPKATMSVTREEATVMIAVDTSRSMKATDVAPTRLDAARGTAKAFLETIPAKYRVGIVGFASQAGVAVPPTDDRALAAQALETLRPGDGTALGDAIVLSARVGQKQRDADGGSPPTAALLISDGTIDGGDTTLEDAIAEARLLKVPFYTVALGTPEGVVEESLPGGFRQVIRVPPTPAALRQVAAATGGKFFTAASADELEVVYAELKSRLGKKKEEREIADAFAAGAVLLLLGGGALSTVWFRRLP